MKNINIKKLEIEPEEMASFIQLKIMQRKASKTIESLKNPDTVNDAIRITQNIISQNKKYLDYIGLNQKAIIKALYIAFSRNKPIESAIELLIRKNSSQIAATKLDALMLLEKVANKAYESSTDLF